MVLLNDKIIYASTDEIDNNIFYIDTSILTRSAPYKSVKWIEYKDTTLERYNIIKLIYYQE